MKHASFLILIVLLALAPITGCKKDQNTLGSMTAVIYSTEFTAATCSAINTGGWYIIKGNTGNKESITIFIKGNLEPATYNFDATLQSHHASYYDGTEIHHATTGSVIIKSVSNNKDVTGAFAFRNPDGTIITDGAFTAVF